MTRQDSLAILVRKMSEKDGGMVKTVMPLEVPGGRRVGLSDPGDLKPGNTIHFAEPGVLLEGVPGPLPTGGPQLPSASPGS